MATREILLLFCFLFAVFGFHPKKLKSKDFFLLCCVFVFSVSSSPYYIYKNQSQKIVFANLTVYSHLFRSKLQNKYNEKTLCGGVVVGWEEKGRGNYVNYLCVCCFKRLCGSGRVIGLLSYSN